MVRQVPVVLVTVACPCISDAMRLSVHLDCIPLTVILAHNVRDRVPSELLNDLFVVLVAAVFLDDFRVLDERILYQLRVDSHGEDTLVRVGYFQAESAHLIEPSTLPLRNDSHLDAAICVHC